MFSLIEVLAAVLLGCVAQDLAATGSSPDALGAMGISVTVPWMLGRWRESRLARQIQSAPWDGKRCLERVRRDLRGMRLAGLACFALLLFVGGWTGLVRDTLGSWPLVDDLALFFPFVLGMITIWRQEARHLLLVGARADAPGRTVLFRLRSLAIPAAPLIALALARDLVHWFGFSHWFEAFAYLPWSALLVFVLLVFLVAPPCLRWLLPTHRLAAGDLRDRLEAYSRGVGFRCREILVWRTEGRFINAAIVGVLPRARYVLLTDGLLRLLPADEVVAVFAHEAAHARKGHPTLYLLVALSFVLWVYPVSALTQDRPWVSTLAVLLLFAGYWLVGFGFVSRRAEREADLEGAGSLPHHDAMSRALERIASPGQGDGWIGAWRHFSTATRVRVLRAAASDGSMLAVARRDRRLVTFVVIGILALGAAASAQRIARDQLEGELRLALLERRFDDLFRRLEEAGARFPADPWLAYVEGTAEQECGRFDLAARCFDRALALSPGAALERAVREARSALDRGPGEPGRAEE